MHHAHVWHIGHVMDIAIESQSCLMRPDMSHLFKSEIMIPTNPLAPGRLRDVMPQPTPAIMRPMYRADHVACGSMACMCIKVSFRQN